MYVKKPTYLEYKDSILNVDISTKTKISVLREEIKRLDCEISTLNKKLFYAELDRLQLISVKRELENKNTN